MLASLKLTVVLFALAMVLVFAGTLAQIDEGIWTAVAKYFRSLYVWIPLGIFFRRDLNVPGGFPFPGGWLIGGVLLVNLLAAHAVRFKVSWKRSGILLVHAGLIVLLLSELVTGLLAVEGNMTLEEGQSADFVEHTHAVELALVDASDPGADDVAVIPGALLRRGGRIRHESLPVDVEVVRTMANSMLVGAAKAGSAAQNPATAGEGLQWLAEERPEISGVDPNQSVDMPSAYVRLFRKGADRPLGTWLASLWLTAPQAVEVDGRILQAALRFRRSYKPYALRLIDFRHDRYVGTDTPKNFSSLVRLTDPGRGVDREVLIWMNHPLRYDGETFYQSSFRGETVTILQVVRNPGWLMPYVSCGMVAGGLLAQFGLTLAGFLRRRRPVGSATPAG